tara:strand:+ start:3378 stop:4106 length:729 start_codon:yes stop_codon:yes gene_type:complete
VKNSINFQRPRKKVNDESGSIGIGAMIVFIALILVAAIASTIIIRSVDNLSMQSSGLVDERMNSKISVESIQIFLYEPCWQSESVNEGDCPGSPWGHHELVMFFTVEGGEDLKPSEVYYTVYCEEDRTVTTPMRSESFEGSSTWESTTSRNEGWAGIPFNQGFVVFANSFLDADARSTTLEPGVQYALMLDLYDNKNNFGNENEGCRISLDYDINLILYVEGGMETYALISCETTDRGEECY